LKVAAKTPSRGIALIEALIALAVMAFGMLAIVGLQSTLRQNGDLSRQRAEAVRLAQAEIESIRAYASLGSALAPAPATFSGLGTRAAIPVPDAAGRSTRYTLTTTVAEGAGLADLAATGAVSLKHVTVKVEWFDRRSLSVAQSVELSTAVHGVAPELAATLSLPANGGPTSGAGGRLPTIPWAAVPLGNGTSGFVPPQAAGGNVVWVINNLTGLFTVCTIRNLALPLTPSNISGCSSFRYQFVSGYVNFANNGSGAATAADALSPSGTAFAVQVQLVQTAPAALAVGPVCFTESPVLGLRSLAYFCAVPVSDTRSLPPWSGYSYVTGVGLPVAPAPGDFATCRYTTVRQNFPTPPLANVQHPRAYLNVDEPLAGQNFLVVRVVSQSATDCPDGTPLPSGSTTYPQPQTPP
jgi:Tfp pilus assembly protein PilV